MSELEARIAEEIEAEVENLIKKVGEVEKEADRSLARDISQRIGFYKLVGRGLESVVKTVREKRVALVSLSGMGDGVLKEAVKNLKTEVEKEGGRVYLLNTPLLLVLPKGVKLEVET